MERQGVMSDMPDFFEGIEEEIQDNARAEWLREALLQIELSDDALEAVDRCVNLSEGDVLVCETTCLGYAVHALSIESGIKELWLVPPEIGCELTPELLDDFELRLRETSGILLDSLEANGSKFRGLTTVVPSSAFKLLITDALEWFPLISELEWPVFNNYWRGMLSTSGSIGVVIKPTSDELAEFKTPSDWPLDEWEEGSLLEGHANGVYYSAGIVRVIELADGHIVLATGEPEGTIILEDLTDASDSWVCEVAAITPAVNGGSIMPSLIRSGVEVVDETALAELTSRISRGTTLSEKHLDVVGDPEPSDMYDPRLWDVMFLVSNGGGHAPSTSEFYAYPGRYYYIDGSCLQNGEIRPKVLDSMPKGQERYVVDSHDGKVLLVSRNSKELAVYEAKNPTLISNSLFVVRLSRSAIVDYIACWMRGTFAKAWLHDGGKMLSKAVLASLPVPILSDETMEQTVRYERDLDEKVYELYQQIAGLKAANRFNPLAAAKGHQCMP